MISELIYIEYLSCLLEGDKAKCSAIVAHLLEHKVKLTELYTHLFQRSLERIGQLWETDRICGATEHLATAITESLINFAYPLIAASPKNGRKAVVSCVPREFHQIGAKMVADIFELHGWNSYYLGANVKTSELFRLLHEKKPDVLALSLGIYLNVMKMLDVIKQAHQEFPDMKIIVGGRAFIENGTDLINNLPEVTYIGSLKNLEEYIENSYMKVKEKPIY